MSIKFRVILLAGCCLALSACSLFRNSSDVLTDEEPNAANGEQIYFTASSQRGGRITYSGGPQFGGMMGSYLTCASCHGPEAGGGRHRMHMIVMDAPDIRYVALSEEMEEHGGEDEMYDLEAFRMAVIDGQHPDGDALDVAMPRWQMSDENLADVFEFLKSLP